MDSLELLQELVLEVGPPGQERAVRHAVARHVEALGFTHATDAKGNLLIHLGPKDKPKVMVTAHTDEIAMMVTRVEADGRLAVTSMGGLYPWKLGESPVLILGDSESLTGVLSFGSIHTSDPASNATKGRTGNLPWEQVRIVTGQSAEELAKAGVRPGTRVAVHPCHRQLVHFGSFVSGYFLDDRADIVAMLLALEVLQGMELDAVFVASAAEEVGGEGALFAMQKIRPDVCIALELGPKVNDAPVGLTAIPTVWANDSYSAMSAEDGALVNSIGKKLGMDLQFQALSGGGSDASCAASKGLCGRPITLGLPMENTHGYEVMHKDAMVELARLTAELVQALA